MLLACEQDFGTNVFRESFDRRPLHHCSELGWCVMKTDHFCPRVGHHVGVPDQTLHSVHNLDYAVDFEDIGSHGTLLCEEMW